MSNNNANDGGGAAVLMCCMLMCLCYCLCSSASSVLGTVLQPTSTFSYTGMDKVWKKELGAADAKGPYTSPAYGNLGNNPMKGRCPKGSYLTDVMAFHGQGEHTNAIQGWCYDPKTQKVQRLFDAPTCGKRDRPKAANVFMDGLNAMMVAIGGVLAVIPGFQAFGATMIAGGVASLAVQGAGLADAKNNLLKGGYGRAVYDYNFLASPAGIYSWEVRPKDNEIQGLNMIGLQGDELGWAGGNRSRTWGSAGPRKGEPTGTIHKGRCASGKIVTGITAACGDRLDGIQFTCDVPPLD